MMVEPANDSCVFCRGPGSSDCFIRGALRREGGPLANLGRSGLRLYHARCLCCESCFDNLAQFNRVRLRGILAVLLNFAICFTAIPTVQWVALAIGRPVDVPRACWGIAVALAMGGTFLGLWICNAWVRKHAAALLPPDCDVRLRNLAGVTVWTASTFPSFTRHMIDDRLHQDL
jgi:hypothetical protein